MDEKLTIGEAAKRYTVSPSAIRRLIDSGKVKSTKDAAGRHMVLAGELTGELSRRVPGSRSGAQTGKGSSDRSGKAAGEPAGDLNVTTDRYLRAIETALDHERRVSEDLRTQNRELQSQLVKLAAEMQALLSKETDGMLSKWLRR